MIEKLHKYAFPEETDMEYDEYVPADEFVVYEMDDRGNGPYKRWGRTREDLVLETISKLIDRETELRQDLKRLFKTMASNTGHEPSVSVFYRELDEILEKL